MSHDTTAPFLRFPRLLVSMVGIGIAAGLLFGMPACGDDETTAPDDNDLGPLAVRVLDNRFSPQTLTISVGDSVTWHWSGSSSHSVTHGTDPGNLGGLFNHGPKSSGTFGYKFTSPGSVPYFCIPHFSMGMTGTITVNP